MGYILHNAIVITSWDDKAIEKAEEAALSFNLCILGPSAKESAINGYRTLLVCPDGSKEGWADSDDGNHRRRKMREWLRDHRLTDGSSLYEWCEVAYGSDDKDAKVIDSEWHKPAQS